jgi:hypothetical protein
MAEIVKTNEGRCMACWRESRPTRIRFGDEMSDMEDVVKCKEPGAWKTTLARGGNYYACEQHHFDLQGFARKK